MREFTLADGSVLVLQNEVDLLDITTLADASRRYLAVQRPIVDSVKVSPSNPPQAGLSDPAGPRARARFFSG